MKLLSCAFNMDTACVELKFDDGSTIAIDTIAVENEVADNMYQRSELDYLIYNDPLAYADHTAACGRNPTGGMFFSEPLDLFRLSEYNYNGFLYRDLRGVCYEWIYYSPGSCLKMGNFSPTSSDSV